MSPEQLSGHPVDERSDVFSLGVIVAEAVTGRHPFAAPSSPQLVANILSRAFQLGEAPKGAERLGEALGRCLAKAPGDRFGSVTAMRAALIPALRTCPPLSRDGLPAAQATATGPGRVTATRMPPPPHPR
jgi:serine/threonine protein kinase